MAFNQWRKNLQLITLVGTVLFLSSAFSGTKLPYIPGNKEAVSVNLKNVKWHKLPTSGKIAYLVSRPDKRGIFIALIKKPPGYTKAPHYHKAAAYLTILSGSCYHGHGNKFIKSKMILAKKGNFSVNLAGYVHYEWSKTGVTFEIVAEGPWKSYYVNEKGRVIKKSKRMS